MLEKFTLEAVLAHLKEDDAEGRGLLASTVATALCGPPASVEEALERPALAERILQEWVEQGLLEIAGYIYLHSGRLARYRLPRVVS